MIGLESLPATIVEAARRGPKAVQAAIATAGGSPVRSGEMVTLLHVGVADSVVVRHWLDMFPAIPEFSPIGDDRIWATSFPLEPDARIEYKLAVHRHNRLRLKLDPLNPHQASNPWGANSVLRGASYQPPEWTFRRPSVPRGTVTRHDIESEVLGEERSLHIYTPAAGTAESVILVHDGSDYLEHAGMAKVLDNLIAEKAIPPVAAAFLDPADRLAEYRGAPRHASHVVEEVLPFARAATGATRSIAMGASLGGVASLHAAWSHPGTFDALVLQAPSLVSGLGPYGRGATFAPVVRFVKRFLTAPGALPERVHISCGRFDGLINEARQWRDYLDELGVAVGYTDIASGHDWHAWRDLLRASLVHVLTGTGQ